MNSNGFIVAFLLLLPLWASGQTEPQKRAEFFNSFLSSRPTVEEVVFKTRPIIGGWVLNIGEKVRRFSTNETSLVFGRWQSNAWFLQIGTDLDGFRAGSLKGILMGFQEERYWQINDPILVRYQGETETAAVVNTLRSLHQVLSFGIPNLQPGTFRWKGTDFEAYDEGGALISGKLQTASDGTPAQIQFHLPGRDWEYSVDYTYDRASPEDVFPSRFRTSIRKGNATSFEPVQETAILSLRTTRSVLPDRLIVPEHFIKSERVISVLSSNGTRYVRHDGQWVQSGAGRHSAAKPTRAGFLFFLAASSFCLVLILILSRKKQSNQNT